jgi:alpha-ketoglutarate-dependent taurine dioxygenase
MKTTDNATPDLKRAWSDRRKTLRPKSIAMSPADLVSVGHLSDDRPLPVLVERKYEAVDLAQWVGDNLQFIESSLLKHGGILFRGFGVADDADFERVLRAVPVPLVHYMEGATPRVELRGKVYTSTSFPSDQTIALHNELCYVNTWPMKIWFYCVRPAEQGGETPIGDVRRVFDRIDPAVRRRFMEKGWMLLRNFGQGFGIPWQTSFRIADKGELEDYFRRNQISFEWKEDEGLRTRQVRPAAATHPKTGEMVWFNHIAFWHVSSLEPQLREMFLREFREEDLPYNTYYGDGSVIEDAVIEGLRAAYREEMVVFPWQHGDVLMLDNMIAAHGRMPYRGERNILVAMGEPLSRATA